MNSCGTKGDFRIMRNDTEGCAELVLIGSVLCDRSVNTEFQVRYQTSPFGFCDGKKRIRTGFSPSFFIFPCHYNSTSTSYCNPCTCCSYKKDKTEKPGKFQKVTKYSFGNQGASDRKVLSLTGINKRVTRVSHNRSTT